jgi:uncharacterized protein
MMNKKSFTLKCPTCRKETVWNGNEFRPFCSERCRLTDLGNWASGEYRVPGAQLPPEDEADNYN